MTTATIERPSEPNDQPVTTNPVAVIWDADGVAFQFTSQFNRSIGLPDDTEWSHWNFPVDHLGGIEPFVAKLRQFGAEGGFGKGEPYPDFIRAFQDLRTMGVTQIMITDKPCRRSTDDCYEWLESIDCKPDWFAAYNDKTLGKQFCEPYQLIYAVDDRPENVEALIGAGVIAYLRDRPWNQNTNLPRVYDLSEFVNLVRIGMVARPQQDGAY